MDTKLNLREGQTVTIDGKVKLKVLHVLGNKVKLGFEAPDDVRVFRKETFDRITGGQDDPAPRPQQSAD